MSGSTIGGIVGGVIGFYFGGPSGAQLGFAIGSTVGGIVKPEHIKGPSIGAAQSQTSSAGIPRPVVFGHPPPFAGNLIDGEKKARKIIKEVQQGKGGGPVSEEEHWLLTSAIRVCEAAPDGIDYLRIWCDGVVVYDARTSFPPGWTGYSKEIKARQKKFLAQARLYRGTEDQLPDSALEAIHGVGKTPYYRGSAYIVVVDDDRTSTGGAVGHWMFEVTSHGTLTTDAEGVSLRGHWPLEGAPNLSLNVSGGVVQDLSSYNQDGDYIGGLDSAGAIDTHTSSSMEVPVIDGGGAVIANASHLHIANSGFPWGVALTFDYDPNVTFIGRRYIAGYWGSFTIELAEWVFYLESSDGVNYWLGGGFNQLSMDFVSVIDSSFDPRGRYFLRHDGTNLQLFKNGSLVDSLTVPPTAWPGGSDGIRIGYSGIYYSYIGAAGRYNNLKIFAGSISDTFVLQDATYFGHYPGLYLPEDPDSVYDPVTGEVINGSSSNIVSETDIYLDYVERRIMERCGVPSDKIDLTALAGITIPGFLIAEQMSGADVLSPLMWAYFHDLPEFDGKIQARLRGGSTVATLADTDFVKTSGEEYDLTPQPMEFPAKLSVVTAEPEADYSPIPQTSFRFSPDIDSTSEIVIELAVPLSANAAKQVADKLHKVRWSQAESFKERTLPGHKYSNLIPTDPIMYGGRRWMITKSEFVDNQHKISFVYDRVSNYSSNAVGQAPTPPEPPTGIISGPTICVPLNAPKLRSQDNVPGFYIGAQGVFTGYQGADIYISIDGGLTYENRLRITLESIIGYLPANEITGPGGEPLTVRLYDLEDTLSNVTADQVLLGQNAAAMVSPTDVCEIIGFESASQNMDGTWDLTSITRGGLNTTEVDHLINQKFMMLNNVYFVPLNFELAGQIIHIRPVTIGTLFDESPIIEFLYNPDPSFFSDGPSLRVDNNGDYRVDSFGNYRSTT